MNEGSGTAFDFSVATDFLENAQTTITQFWTTNKAGILIIVGFAVGLSLMWFGYRLWKKVTNKAG